MMVSTRGRYALRVMTDIAEHNTGAYIPLSDIAERQGISEKYLESIISVLSKNGLLDSVRGKGGGYRLSRQPERYTVLEILKLTEGTLAPVACLEANAPSCERASYCKTVALWEGLEKVIDDYLANVRLSDLLGGADGGDYVI